MSKKNELIGQIIPQTKLIGIPHTQNELNVEILGVGPKGKDGFTPIKGQDYFTQDDINYIIDLIGLSHYTHTQIKSSKVWIIPHNLNKFPSITIVDSANTVVVGNIEYIDNNTAIVSFSAEFSGKAYLN